MNIFSAIFESVKGTGPTDEQMRNIRNWIDILLNSNETSTEIIDGALEITRYTDPVFCVVKTALTYPNGSCEVHRSIVLRDNTQVYDDMGAIKLAKWYDHLESVAKEIKEKEDRKGYEKKRNSNLF